MKKISFLVEYLRNMTLNGRFAVNAILLMMVSLCINTSLSAQMPCEGHLNVSLNSDCEYQVLPQRFLTDGAATCASGYSVMLSDHYDAAIVGDILGRTHLGQTVTVKVINNCTTNSCWGTILVEDKQAPTLTCGTVNVFCYDEAAQLPTANDNCDENVKVIAIGGSTTLSDCDPANDILKTISREYIAEDSNGLQSSPCTHTVNVLRINQDNIDYPNDFVDAMSFNCNSEFPKDENGNPHPDTTGIPYLIISPTDSLALYPDITDLCKARMTYDDTVIGSGSCKVKIMRRWSFYDACTSSDPDIHVQMIFIEDKIGPEIECKDSITIVGTPVNSNTIFNSNTSVCNLAINIPPAAATDNCSTIQGFGIELDGVPVLATNGGTITTSPGMHTLTYVTSDGCNDSEKCNTIVQVIDNSPPVAICDKHSVIGLTEEGEVEVLARVFDDGSFDACEIGEMLIARVDSSTCDIDAVDFGPTITFCCADINQTIQATFRVADLTGAFNDCMVHIEVQDKTAVAGNCPPSVSIDCDHPLDLNDLSEFGEATAFNKCKSGVEEIEPLVDLNTCNNGSIIRRWVALGLGSEVVCTQTIQISNPFDYASIDDIIIKPRNIDTTGACGLSLLPDNLPADAQRPQILETNACDLIGTTYKDEEFLLADESGACMKIIRTWTILNWCAPEANNTLQWAQIIKVTDTEGPVVIIDPSNSDTFCNDQNNCENGTVTLSASASDNCTIELRSQVLIDLNNDGSIDETAVASLVFANNNTTASVQYTYPLGTHRVQFVFIDGCGLQSTKDHIFTVKNCKAPTCVLNNLNINLRLMDQGPMECIWASDFDASSNANCSQDTLSFFFDADFQNPNQCVTCVNIGTQSIDIYVVDEFGNSAVCRPMLTVTDHDDLCATSNLEEQTATESISGLIVDDNGGMIENAMVSIVNTEYPNQMSDSQGQYAFSTLPMHKDYNLNVEKDDDVMNGVSTLDLVIIQKHILGLDLLDNPYDIIAADINKSGNVSGLDLVELRKLILGNIDKFPSNKSWRFVDKNYEFINPTTPLSERFSENYEVVDLSEQMKIDFVGVKVGDVSGNATTNNIKQSEVRSRRSLNLFSTVNTQAGSNIISVEISSDNFNGLYGFQTTLAFENSEMEFIGVEGGSIDLSQNNVGKSNTDRGMLTLSWSSPYSEKVNEDEVLFKLFFRSMSDKAGDIKVNSDLLDTEVYFEHEVSNIIDLVNSSNQSLTITQNVPNPWSDRTEIKFESDIDREVRFAVYDLFGKQIYIKSITAQKGINSVAIDRTDIKTAGIYLYELSTSGKKKINKMIIID